MNHKAKRLLNLALLIPLVLSIFLLAENTKVHDREGMHIEKGEWNKKYGVGWIEDMKKDGKDYICVAATWNPMDPWNNDVKVIKIDGNGNEIWNRTYETKENSEWPESIEVVDDGYVILSASENSKTHTCNYSVFKIDREGNVIWSKEFGHEGVDDIPTKMIKTADGFLLAGWTHFGDSLAHDIWLIKIDREGNEMWNKTYGVKGHIEGVDDVLETDDGYILFGWTDFYVECEIVDIWLVKIDKQGNEIWNKSIGTVGFTADVYAVEIEDGYMITASTDVVPTVYLIKVDKEGNKIWEKRHGGYDITGVRDIIKVEDGYLIAGTTDYRDVGYFDGWLLKVDKDGNKIWEKKFGGREKDEIDVVLETEDGYLLGGEIGVHDPNIPYFYSYSWIIKCKDYPPPEIDIVRPKKNHLYVFDREIMPFFTTIAIGDLTIEVTSDNPELIKKVEFYLTGFFVGYDWEPRGTAYSYPYKWKLDVFVIPVPFRPIEVRCVAHYGNSGAVATDGMYLYVMNLI